jgi:hypothetical protein
MNVTAELTLVQYQTDGEHGSFDVTGCVEYNKYTVKCQPKGSQ